jgi:hypothetical protein
MRERNLDLSDALNIPESGDSIPDVLNEAHWELQWMLKMQKADGGVFNKLASEIWEGGLPHVSDLGGQSVRFLLPRTTHDTATAGAIFAMAARVWGNYGRTELAGMFLDRAILAWQFLQARPKASPVGGPVNPPGHISGPYPDIDDADNRAWLAAELYRTTCTVSFGQYYVDYIRNNSNIIAMGGNDFTDFRIEAHWAFYYSSACKTSPTSEPTSFTTTRNLIAQGFLRNAQGMSSRLYANTYHNVGRTDVAGISTTLF